MSTTLVSYPVKASSCYSVISAMSVVLKYSLYDAYGGCWFNIRREYWRVIVISLWFIDLSVLAAIFQMSGWRLIHCNCIRKGLRGVTRGIRLALLVILYASV